MKRIKLLLALLLMLSGVIEAQNIRVMPVSTSNMSASAASMLYNRLTQAVTLNGLASTADSNRFLLVPEVTVVAMDATTTAPVKYVAEVEIAVSMVDNSEKVILSQVVLTKKGIGGNTTKAVNEAIKSLKARDSKLKKMIVIGKDKIVDYYDAECDSITETINAYLEKGMYDEAVNELNAMPQIGNGCYENLKNIFDGLSEEQKDASNRNVRKQTPDVSWVNE